CHRLSSSYVARMRYLFSLKEDEQVCRDALSSGTFYLFHSLRPLLQKKHSGYLAPKSNLVELKEMLDTLGGKEQKLEDSVLIGCSENLMPQFALDLGKELFLVISRRFEKPALESYLQGTFIELRKALFLLNGNVAPLLSKAQALLRWHDNNQYCSKTGQPTQKNIAGSKRICNANGIIYYPQMSPVVITLVSNGDWCLLARQETFPAGMYSALAGFCDIGETVEEAIYREVAEEVGLEVESLMYAGSQHWPFPNSSLMIACHATVRQGHTEINVNKFELENARWFSLEEVKEAFQHKRIPPERKDGTVPVWIPPKLAIARQLIEEWVQRQMVKESCATTPA
uniref:NAD(+) diphosphatase n=1 Tax=Latimeria chalumnae TaxID=7897 RepID=H3AMU0_LATCH